MPNSEVNCTFEFNEEKWVVSLVNSIPGLTGFIAGHAVIVVEGLKRDGSHFKGEYEIFATAIEGENPCIESVERFAREREAVEEKGTLQKPIQHAANTVVNLSNVKGVIHRIRCNPTNEIRQQAHPPVTVFKRIYSELQSNSWYTTPELADKMIAAMEADSLMLETEVNAAKTEHRPTNYPFKYQKAGAYRWSIWGGNEGHNCVTWAEEKLAIANVGQGKKIFDSKKAIPELHVRQCFIL